VKPLKPEYVVNPKPLPDANIEYCSLDAIIVQFALVIFFKQIHCIRHKGEMVSVVMIQQYCRFPATVRGDPLDVLGVNQAALDLGCPQG
jgi:hypothetical protein